MLAETDATTTLLPPDDRTPARQEREAGRPLLRETRDPVPPSGEPERQAETRGDDKPRRNKTRRAMRASLAALLLASVAGGGYLYCAARQFAVAPKVAGYITDVPVTDNEHVAAGQVIARIDERDYRTALAQAEAQVAAAQASIDNIDAQTQVQQAQVSQNQSQIEQAQASLTFDQQQEARYRELARTGAGTVAERPAVAVAAPAAGRGREGRAGNAGRHGTPAHRA